MRQLAAASLLLLPAVAAAQAPPAACLPDCRSGFMCVAGQCVSRCNPPCAAGERCTGAGECELPAPPPPPSSVPGEGTALAPDSSGATVVRELPGWALGGAVIGFISAGAVTGVALASALTNSEVSGGPSLPLGASATLLFAITVPIVAGASASVRSGAGVSGSVSLRVLGWILYGLTLSNAVVAVALGVSSYVPSPVIYALAGLCFLTELVMSIEALLARSEASALVEKNQRSSTGARVLPYFSAAPLPGRTGAMASFGLAGSF